MLKNAAGEIICVDLDGKKEIEAFLKEYGEEPSPWKLETLIIAGYEKTKTVPQLVEFLNQHGANLKRVYFVASPRGANELEESHLMEILQALQSAPVEDFRWEHQGKIKSYQMLIAFSRFWKKLKRLSFKGTDLNTKNFFLTQVTWDSLEYLDLSYTNLDWSALKSMSQESARFPRLHTLDIDATRVIPTTDYYAVSPLNFPNLKHLSIWKHKSYPVKWMEQDTALFGKLEYLFWYPERDVFANNETITTDGEFVYQDGRLLAHNNFRRMTQRAWASLSGLKFCGLFCRDYSGDSTRVPAFLRNQVGGLGWFFAEQEDVEQFLTNYPEAQPREVTLASPGIDEAVINRMLSAQSFSEVENLYLVSTGLFPSELFALRHNSPLSGARVHTISVRYLYMVVQTYTFPLFQFNIPIK